MAVGGLLGVAGWGLSAAALAGGALLYTRGGRPALRGAMVSYLAVADRVREITAETIERFQDVFAEAEAEYRELRATAEELPVESPTPLRPTRARGGGSHTSP